MAMLRLKERLELFQLQHPRVAAFLNDVGLHAVETGSVIELKVSKPDGKTYVTNIRVTPEDMETLKILQELKTSN